MPDIEKYMEVLLTVQQNIISELPYYVFAFFQFTDDVKVLYGGKLT